MSDHQDLVAPARRRWSIALVLTGVIIVAYLGFLWLVAYQKALLASTLMPGMSVGILMGAGLIVFAWLLTGYYVHWTNRHYDPAIARFLEQQGGHDGSR